MTEISANRAFFILTLSLLSSCASVDRHAYTTFEPTIGPNQEKQFKFFSKSDIIYPENTSAGEEARMTWIRRWLSDNSYCDGGFKIIDRKAVSIGGWDSAKNIFYTGECV